MPIVLGFVLLAFIFLLYKLFIDGWLFKGTLLIAGWFGLFILISGMEGGSNTPMTIGDSPISWACIVPTIVCLLALLTTKVED